MRHCEQTQFNLLVGVALRRESSRWADLVQEI
jgi:hypothetical protein